MSYSKEELATEISSEISNIIHKYDYIQYLTQASQNNRKTKLPYQNIEVGKIYIIRGISDTGTDLYYVDGKDDTKQYLYAYPIVDLTKNDDRKKYYIFNGNKYVREYNYSNPFALGEKKYIELNKNGKNYEVYEIATQQSAGDSPQSVGELKPSTGYTKQDVAGGKRTRRNKKSDKRRRNKKSSKNRK